jgi:hypothetical protein
MTMDVVDAGVNTCAQAVGPIVGKRSLAPPSIDGQLLRHSTSPKPPTAPTRRKCSRYLMRGRSRSRSCTALPRTFLRSRYVAPTPQHAPSSHTHIVACTGPQPNDAW